MQFSDYYPSWKNLVVGKKREMLRYLGARSAKRVFSVLPQALEAYAKVGFALADAGIRCWAEKYRHNYLRPIDYIRDVMGEPEWNTVMCPDGSGRGSTPNFPAYPSGHSTFGAASAVVLADVFGEDYGMTDRCHEDRTEFNGTPRTFGSFFEMAKENAVSRLYLGVHFRMDSDAGLALGYEVGEKVLKLPWK
jgi:membrane-associated phospholipid phosphatase